MYNVNVYFFLKSADVVQFVLQKKTVNSFVSTWGIPFTFFSSFTRIMAPAFV